MGQTRDPNTQSRLLRDAIGWDTVNWLKAIPFWESRVACKFWECRALEIGAGGNGGLSLWLADRGAQVTCSGYRGVSQEVRTAHATYRLSKQIEYAELDATPMHGEEEYDVIAHKSVLGGIVRGKGLECARNVVREIATALRPGGTIIFAENLSGTPFHRLLRTRFGAGRNQWHYFTPGELISLYSDFSSVEVTTFGFMGCFGGSSEPLRKVLGHCDSLLFDHLTPSSWHYIMAGIAVK